MTQVSGVVDGCAFGYNNKYNKKNVFIGLDDEFCFGPFEFYVLMGFPHEDFQQMAEHLKVRWEVWVWNPSLGAITM